MNRRSFLSGLIAAPAVVRGGILMPLRGIVMPLYPIIATIVATAEDMKRGAVERGSLRFPLPSPVEAGDVMLVSFDPARGGPNRGFRGSWPGFRVAHSDYLPLDRAHELLASRAKSGRENTWPIEAETLEKRGFVSRETLRMPTLGGSWGEP